MGISINSAPLLVYHFPLSVPANILMHLKYDLLYLRGQTSCFEQFYIYSKKISD